MRRFCTVLLLLASTVSAAGAQSAETDATDKMVQIASVAPLIPNFGVVTDKIYRGAAPNDKAIEKLATGGVKTIIDLRKYDAADRRRERKLARQLGVTYIHLPMGYVKRPDAQLKEFLGVVTNPVYQPVYVHCRQGADRTGTVVAAYRIIRQHWTVTKAYKEMRSHHFKPWLFTLKKTVQTCSEGHEV